MFDTGLCGFLWVLKVPLKDMHRVGLIVQSKLTGGMTGCLSLRVSPVTD